MERSKVASKAYLTFHFGLWWKSCREGVLQACLFLGSPIDSDVTAWDVAMVSAACRHLLCNVYPLLRSSGERSAMRICGVASGGGTVHVVTAQTLWRSWWLGFAFNEMPLRWNFEPFPSGLCLITWPEMNGQHFAFEVVSRELPCLY